MEMHYGYGAMNQNINALMSPAVPLAQASMAPAQPVTSPVAVNPYATQGAMAPPAYAAMAPAAPPAPDAATINAQFAAQQAQLQQAYIPSTAYAAYMDPSMTYASAGMMTQANQGVFRQMGVANNRTVTSMRTITGEQRVPYAFFPGDAEMGALIGEPTMERIRPANAQFRRGFDARLDLASEYSRVAQGMTEDYAKAAGQAMVIAGSGAVGSTFGGAVGYGIGGVRGAALGADIGGVATSALAAADPFGITSYIAEDTALAFRPDIERRASAIQTQFASRRFMSGGRDLDISGAGLSTDASMRYMDELDKIAKASGGRFNRSDLVDFTQMAGEQDLMEFSSDTRAMTKTIKDVMGVLGTVAEITGDPDFKTNLKKIAQLKRFGFSVGEVGTAMRNADSYARMAGMDVDQLMQTGGLQGAAMFSRQGLDAATGFRTGMFTQGAAKLAVQGGAFDAQTLAMYGGKSGVAQLMTEASANFAGGTLRESLLPYLMRKGKDGALTIDNAALGKLMSGEVDFEEAIRRGSGKFAGDTKALDDLMSRRDELTAQVSRRMGAEGTQNLLLLQGKQMSDRLGVSLTSGLTTMGLTQEQARVMARTAESPEYWANLKRQQEAERQRLVFDAEKGRAAQFADNPEGFVGRLGRKWRGLENRYGLNMPEQVLNAITPKMIGDTDAWLAEQEESKRLEMVGMRRLRGGNEGLMLSDAMLKGIEENNVDTFDLEPRKGKLRYNAYRRGGYLDTAEAVTGIGARGNLVRTVRSHRNRDPLTGALRDAVPGMNMAYDAIDAVTYGREQMLQGGTLEGAREKMDREYLAAMKEANIANDVLRMGSTGGMAQLSGVVGDLAGEGATKEERDRKELAARNLALRMARATSSQNAGVFSESDMRQLGAGLGLTDADFKSGKFRATVMSMAQQDMTGKQRETMTAELQRFSEARRGALEEDFQRGAYTGSAGAVSALRDMGFGGWGTRTFGDMSKEDQALITNMSERSDEDNALIMLLALGEDTTLTGSRTDRAKAADVARQRLTPKQARRLEQLRKSMTRKQRADLVGKSLLADVDADVLKSADAMDVLARKAGGVRSAATVISGAQQTKEYATHLADIGVLDLDEDMIKDMSDTELMGIVRGLSDKRAARVSGDVRKAAANNNRSAFLKAIQRTGKTGSGATTSTVGLETGAVRAQDRLIESTNRMAEEMARTGKKQVKALEENTRALRGEGGPSSFTDILWGATPLGALDNGWNAAVRSYREFKGE